MMLKPINPPGMVWPGVSQAVIAYGGGILVSSGQMPTGADGEIVSDDFEAQTIAVYENIGRTLQAAGLGFEHIIRVTTYVTRYEPALVDIIRRVRSRYLSQTNPPASIILGVAALYDARMRIEVEVTAVVP
jgi:enamine deaminase RidA (YjgF/YER057c/UK114 family)